MKKTVEIPEGYEARIEGNKVIIEPKESEDEKIRKQLINEVKEQIDNIPAPHCCNSDDLKRLTILESWLAYLERQKEPQPVEWEWPSLSNCIKNCKKCHGKCFYRKEPYEELKALGDVVKNVTKDKETATKFLKSAGIMDDNGELAEMYRSEQKPAEWSEREKRLMKALQITNARIAELVEENYNLKEQKQEWSEEDEQIGKEIIFLLKNADSGEELTTLHSTEEMIAWLEEKLKSFNHSWKPSEEQMEELLAAIEYLDIDGHEDTSILDSLYNDLKKNYSYEHKSNGLD